MRRQHLQLRLVQVLHRHGDRTPLHTFEQNEGSKYWLDKIADSSVQSKASLQAQDGHEHVWGQLTNVGRRQLFDTGRRFAALYPEIKNPSLAYSTNYRRTVESAEAFINGFSSRGLPVQCVSGQDDMINSYSVYPEIKQMKLKIQQKEFPEKEKSMEGIKIKLIQALGPNLTTENFNWMKVADYFWCRRAHDVPLVPGTEEYQDSVIKHLAFRFQKFYSNREILSRVSGRLLKHIDFMEKSTMKASGEPKLVLYSGHDVSVLGLLHALQAPCVLEESYWPVYGSSITFEEWEDKVESQFYSRVYLNESKLLI